MGGVLFAAPVLGVTFLSGPSCFNRTRHRSSPPCSIGWSRARRSQLRRPAQLLQGSLENGETFNPILNDELVNDSLSYSEGEDHEVVSGDGAGWNNGSGDSFRGGDGGAEEGEGKSGSNPEILSLANAQEGIREVLASFNASLESLPQDVAQAVSGGYMTKDQLQSYLGFVESVPLFGWLLKTSRPFRDRFLADGKFMFKVLVQELIGNGTCLAGEITERGPEIWNEIEYVISDLAVGTVVEASFVWVLAPRIPFPALATANETSLGRWLGSLPSNIFEKSVGARSFSIAQRAACFTSTGLTYAAIGLLSGVVGTALTYGFIECRKKLNPNYIGGKPLPPLVSNSLGWAAFMGISSNSRFQAVEGVERILGAALRSSPPAVSNAVIVGVRFGNNYWGGIQFIRFFRWLGLQ